MGYRTQKIETPVLDFSYPDHVEVAVVSACSYLIANFSLFFSQDHRADGI